MQKYALFSDMAKSFSLAALPEISKAALKLMDEL